MPELAGQDFDPTSPAETPDAPGSDIEKIRQEAIAAANAAADERIKGFQRLIAERDARERDLSRQLEEARLASLPEDDREAELEKRREQELDRLRAENELLKLMPEYPEELPVFQRLLAAPDAKTQLELLRSLRQPAAPAPTPAPETSPAPVDPNNPVSSALGGVVLSDGTTLTDDLAERLLRSVPRLR